MLRDALVKRGLVVHELYGNYWCFCDYGSDAPNDNSAPIPTRNSAGSHLRHGLTALAKGESYYCGRNKNGTR